MTQGLFINGKRPKSKKEVREHIDQAYNPGLIEMLGATEAGEYLHSLHVEATSFFGNEYDGPLSNNAITNPITFVGPDPHTKRNFYGRIEWNVKKGRWIVS